MQLIVQVMTPERVKLAFIKPEPAARFVINPEPEPRTRPALAHDPTRSGREDGAFMIVFDVDRDR